MRLRFVWLLTLFASCTHAASPHKEVVNFSYTNDVGFGNSVFVVGNHPDLGAWDVTHATKLRFTSGNVWVGQIAVQAGTPLQYSYIKRSTAQDSWCDSSNATYLTGVLTQNVAVQPPAPYKGKTIYYLSNWNLPNLFYRNGANWIAAAMTKIGPGRSAAESLFKISGVGEAGEPIEFVFNDGNGNWDNPPGGGNYLTNIDVFQVQDGNVFSYQPTPVVSAPHIIITEPIESHATNIPDRPVRIYLPRGYDQNITRRYPVVYFHDGQNIFDPGGPFGSWHAETVATREIGQGRMREAILVGIDNDNNNRIWEYLPPTDKFQNTDGRADAYASFVINDVRPHIDQTFRTLNEVKNTATIGSSMGGLVSLYLGREFSIFGRIAVMSPAFWTAPNYVTQVRNGAKKNSLRVHLDMGTSEGQDNFDNCLSMYDTHLAQNYAAGGDVEFVAGCGQQHNEAAWSARLSQVFDYLLPAREDPAELTQREYPPILVMGPLDQVAQHASFNYVSLFGFIYTLQRSTDLVHWDDRVSTSVETFPWTNGFVNDDNVPMNGAFWRLHADPVL